MADLLTVSHLKKYFSVKGGDEGETTLKAVDDISFSIAEGETLGLVGESGCGKSTVGKCLVRLYEPTDGQIVFQGTDITHLSTRQIPPLRRNIQMIFQDPYSSLDPRMNVKAQISEGMKIQHLYKTKAEREYWAQRRGQRRLDHANAKLAAEGQQPTQTVYQTELDKLRKQIYAVLNKTTTFEEFSALLMQEHGIAVKESRGRLSYCPPGRTKFITAKKLSKKLEKEQVLTALSQNNQLTPTIKPSGEQKPDKIRKLVDIQANVAAGKGIGYERWAKKFNLKRWSQTLCLLQEKKLLSEDALHQRIAELQTQHDDALAVVKDLDARMVSLKELRGHLVVYRQYKPLAQKLQTVRNPAKFKEQHRAEFAVYEAACAYFKANGLRTLPDLKKLDAEYQTLSSEKNGFYTRYKKAQIELRELRTAQQNVEAFFRKEERGHAVPQQEVK